MDLMSLCLLYKHRHGDTKELGGKGVFPERGGHKESVPKWEIIRRHENWQLMNYTDILSRARTLGLIWMTIFHGIIACGDVLLPRSVK